jgi:hypothetical protein
MVRLRAAADISNEVEAHDNDVRTDASKATALQMCMAYDEDAAFQGPVSSTISSDTTAKRVRAAAAEDA